MMLRPLIHPARLASAALLLTLAGCVNLAPDYQRPAPPVPAQLGNGTALEPAPLSWQQLFQDERLRAVIDMALINNRDLRASWLQIERARALYRVQDAQQWPGVDLSTQANASRSINGANGAQISRTSTLQLGVSSWELDLFGRVRSLTRKTLETYLAAEQTQRGTQLSLVAETATAWMALAAGQQRLLVARDTLASQRHTLRLTEAMHAEGLVSGVDLASVQASVESARVDVASYETELAQARNALDLLAGASVPARLLPDASTEHDAIALPALPAALPATVLLRRPDVQAAEHTLLAANADIGAARAAFFPRISLTATTGLGSVGLNGLFEGNTHQTWSFSPNLNLPIFDAGQRRAELDAARFQRDAMLAEYERVIQVAFRETADALALRARIDERLQAQRALLAATARGYELANARYRDGVDSYLETLTAQRSLYNARQNLITLQLADVTNRITLFKVLGGDADARPDGPPPPA